MLIGRVEELQGRSVLPEWRGIGMRRGVIMRWSGESAVIRSCIMLLWPPCIHVVDVRFHSVILGTASDVDPSTRRLV